MEFGVTQNQANNKLAIQELLIKGFTLFKTGFRDILGILITQTFSLIALIVILFTISLSFYDNANLTSLPPKFIISILVSILIILFVQLGFIAAFTTKFWAIAHQKRISSTHAYRLGISKALPLLAWVLIYIVLVGIGLALFVIPGLIIAAALFMGAALIIQNRYSTLGALKASYKMVWPNLQQTLFYIVMSAAITLTIYFLTLYPLGLLISYLTNSYPLLNGIFDIARYALIVMLVPLFVALIIPYYMEVLKLKHDETLK